MDEKISIILPVYNSESTVRETIESVISQSYENYELIIINDGSTDRTKEICEEYDKSCKIKLINIKNSGPSHARNIGIEESDGKYIMFIDSDDTYSKEMLKSMHKCITKNSVDLVVCNYYCKNNSNIKRVCNISDGVFRNIQIEECIETLMKNKLFNVIWNKIYFSDIIKDNNIRFNENIELGEDYCFNIDYFESIKDVYIIGESLYTYKIMTNSVCTKYRENLFELKMNNINYQKEMYLRKSFSIAPLVDKYLDCLKSSVMTIESNKSLEFKQKMRKINEQIDVIDKVINNIKIKNINKENKLIRILVIHRLSFFMYFYMKIKRITKVCICKLKNNKYR